MIAATLYRESDDGHQSLGRLVIQGLELKTLELPWLGNQTDVSCIPAGTYACTPRTSTRYGHHYRVTDVRNRTMILIHAGNDKSHTHGCILVGMSRADINGDGFTDLASSRKALDKLLSIAPDGFSLSIRAHNQDA